MALSGMQWQELAVLTRELEHVRLSKPKEKRSADDKAIVKYFKIRLKELEEQKTNHNLK